MSEQQEAKPVLIPGPDHPITVEPNPLRVRVWADGEPIADTRNSLTLREASYPPVEYIPIEDVDMSRLLETDDATYCPYKGDANYYGFKDRAGSESTVWEYREPYESVAALKGRVAFYPDRVERIEQLAEES
jgi:uncharacterized protein (DUF427 family)